MTPESQPKGSEDLLSCLPSEGAQALAVPGGVVGAVDAGGGVAVAFKFGAAGATRAGDGIRATVLDLVATGARPVALLGSLRFGEIGESEVTRAEFGQTVEDVLRGGAALDVPTVAVDILFEPSYQGAALVNVMVVGVASADQLTPARGPDRMETPDSGATSIGDGSREPSETPPSSAADHPADAVEPEPPIEPMYPKGPMVIPTGWSGGGTIVKMLQSANLSSRLPLLERHGAGRGPQIVRGPGQADAAVLLPASAGGDHDAEGVPVPAIAVTVGGNGRRVAVNPRAGAAEVVYACAANLACVGAEPLGLTHSLHFGASENPNVVWQLRETIDGIAQACGELGIPAVGGEAPHHSRSPGGPILPTPVIGMVGSLSDASRAGRVGFHTPGEKIALIGSFNPLRDGGEIAKLHGHPLAGMIPFKDIAAIREAHDIVREGVGNGRFTSAHHVAEGGLGVALAESCIAGENGAAVLIRGFIDVFGEDLGTTFLVTGSTEDLAGLNVIGEVGGDQLDIQGVLIVPVADLQVPYGSGLTSPLR